MVILADTRSSVVIEVSTKSRNCITLQRCCQSLLNKGWLDQELIEAMQLATNFSFHAKSWAGSWATLKFFWWVGNLLDLETFFSH